MLVSFLTIIIITVSALGANFYFQTSGDIKQSAISNLERLSDQSVQKLNSRMDNIKNEAWNYFGDPELQTFLTNFSANSDKLGYF
ncbi:hypothetical protein HQN89_28105 [Paenibacillus frigoriresistens]|uniref:hypothetical protein n=1 Tax=Paenibacillus alginolyticus TaxID=59839 RepID=UPI0015672DEA|nr:hypothetical protein [Paenibacillus frigoriresistens]NRF94763.1 hypothetical protein [Paenibacillus frigoriresistens]